MSTTLHMKISCCMGLGPEQQHNECLTASTATTYSSALLEKVFLQDYRAMQGIWGYVGAIGFYRDYGVICGL